MGESTKGIHVRVSNWRHIFVKLVFSWGTTEHHQTCRSLLWLTGSFKYYKCNALDLSYDVHVIWRLCTTWLSSDVQLWLKGVFLISTSLRSVTLTYHWTCPSSYWKLYQHFPQIMWKKYVRLFITLLLLYLMSKKLLNEFKNKTT